MRYDLDRLHLQEPAVPHHWRSGQDFAGLAPRSFWNIIRSLFRLTIDWIRRTDEANYALIAQFVQISLRSWVSIYSRICLRFRWLIFRSLEKRQTMLFSATQTRKVEDLARISLNKVNTWSKLMLVHVTFLIRNLCMWVLTTTSKAPHQRTLSKFVMLALYNQ